MKGFFGRLATLSAGGVVGQLGAALAAPLLSRLYPPETYGLAGLVQSVVIVLALAATLRYDAVIVAGRSRRSRAAAAGLALLLLLSVCGALGAAVAVGAAAGALSPLYFFAAIILALNVAHHRILPPLLINDGRYALVSISSAVAGLGGAAAQIGLGLLGFGAAGILAGRVVGQIGAIATQVAPVWSGTIMPVVERLRWRSLRRVFAGYRRQAVFLAPAGVVNALAVQLPVFVLAAQFGLAASGAFFFVQALANAVLGVYTKAMNPLIARYVREGRAARRPTAPFVVRVLGALGLVAILGAVSMIALGEWLAVALFGPEWALSGVVLKWIGFFYAASVIHHPLAALSTILGFQASMLGVQVLQLAGSAAAMAIGVAIGSMEVAVAGFSLAAAAVFLGNAALVLGRLRADDRARAG